MKNSATVFGIIIFAFALGASTEAPQRANATRPEIGASKTDSVPESGVFGFGHPAPDSLVRAWDIDVRPDGAGLPSGTGIPEQGRLIYNQKCVACHGSGGVGGPNGSLVTADTGQAKRKERTIGNYWPYATTVFDYIRRAMPFNQPGSLTDAEVYHLTAYLLAANRIIDSAATVDARSLPKIIMPSKHLFVPDDRKGGAEIR